MAASSDPVERAWLDLPDFVRETVTLAEYRWMSPAQRADLLTDMTTPDINE